MLFSILRVRHITDKIKPVKSKKYSAVFKSNKTINDHLLESIIKTNISMNEISVPPITPIEMPLIKATVSVDSDPNSG